MSPASASHFFGRRKGKALRRRQSDLMQTFLPQLRVDLAHPAPRAYSDLNLEIGFGGGEHLVSDALNHPDIGFIGCEPFINGVAKILAAISEKQIANIAIHDGDAVEVLDALPDESVSRISILYPDPWPKFRQRKRRFISAESLDKMARVLKNNGELRFATDIDDYSGWTLARIARSENFDWNATTADDWKRPWPNWPGTRYEAKAIREGRSPAYLTFVRRARTNT